MTQTMTATPAQRGIKRLVQRLAHERIAADYCGPFVRFDAEGVHISFTVTPEAAGKLSAEDIALLRSFSADA